MKTVSLDEHRNNYQSFNHNNQFNGRNNSLNIANIFPKIPN